MACGSCGVMIYGNSEPAPRKTTLASAGTDCDFGEDQLMIWKDLFICVKNKNLLQQLGITDARVNSALGIINSALNHRANLCYFERYLSEIQPLVLQIISLGQC